MQALCKLGCQKVAKRPSVFCAGVRVPHRPLERSEQQACLQKPSSNAEKTVRPTSAT